MSLHWYSVVVDAHDVHTLARWWAETLDFQVIYEADDEVVIVPAWASDTAGIETDEQWRRQPHGLVFVPVPEGKTVKNRLHIDLAPHLSQDRDAEIAARVARGAARIAVGQSADVSWTVLADPEGNEFCVLSSRNR